jgi:uncharacterized protein with von Willebrand factor type A (vWA) domain
VLFVGDLAQQAEPDQVVDQLGDGRGESDSFSAAAAVEVTGLVCINW